MKNQILWVLWNSLDQKMEEALEQYADWGVAGVKVDFMQRDDQKVVDFYWRTAAAAAKRKLLVNFHGSYKPTGIRRAYPNVLTREGVRGLEQNKWGTSQTVEQDLFLPFIRMAAGPLDYTPGAMRNAQSQNFTPIFTRPMSQGTRVHQLAMYGIFESPLQMLADSPSNYLREKESVEFISKYPAVWDETIPLAGEIGRYVVIARRSGDTYFLSAMNGSSPQKLKVPLSFLKTGAKYKSVVFRDGPNAEVFAEDYQRSADGVFKKGDNLMISMASGGGFAARFELNKSH